VEKKMTIKDYIHAEVVKREYVKKRDVKAKLEPIISAFNKLLKDLEERKSEELKTLKDLNWYGYWDEMSYDGLNQKDKERLLRGEEAQDTIHTIELKKVKAMDNVVSINLAELRQEAIKWIKEFGERKQIVANPDEFNGVIIFIKHFFNIIEEDLK